MPRRTFNEEPINHEAWAIPYGDLLTLLLAFFVMMYAVSSVNEGKYRVVSDSLSEAFGAEPMRFEGVPMGNLQQRVPDPQGSPTMQPAVQREAEPVSQTVAMKDAWLRETARQQRMDSLAGALQYAMADLIGAGEIAVKRNSLSIEVDIRADILFASASAVLGSDALATVQRIGSTLAPFPNSVNVIGHTDNQPITSLQYPSNWELSAARAASVVKIFVANGVAPTRVAVIGFGAERPKADNVTFDGRNQNRRVVLVISSETDDDNDDPVASLPPRAPLAAAAGSALDAGGRP